MKFSKTSPAEKAALVRMVSATMRAIVCIGRCIKGDPEAVSAIDMCAEDFVDATIGVQESEEEAVRESYQ